MGARSLTSTSLMCGTVPGVRSRVLDEWDLAPRSRWESGQLGGGVADLRAPPASGVVTAVGERQRRLLATPARRPVRHAKDLATPPTRHHLTALLWVSGNHTGP